MSVSGHKSVQSLAIYQKTKEKEKIKMGKALFQSMTRNEDKIDINKNIKEIQAPRPVRLALPPAAPPQATLMAVSWKLR